MRTKHEVDVERETRATGEGNPPPSSESGAPCSPKKKTAGKNIGGEKKEKEN